LYNLGQNICSQVTQKAWFRQIILAYFSYKSFFETQQTALLSKSKITKRSEAVAQNTSFLHSFSYQGVYSHRLSTLRFIKDKTFRPLTLGKGQGVEKTSKASFSYRGIDSQRLSILRVIFKKTFRPLLLGNRLIIQEQD